MSKAAKSVKLSKRHDKFCREYVIDFNGTQAATRAGFSKRTANQQGSRLLAKVNIQSRIAELTEKSVDDLELSKKRVIQEYRRLAFLDIRKAFTEDGALMPLGDLDDDTAAAIAGVEAENIYDKDEDGNRILTGRILKVKLANKLGALDSLARHYGMFVDKSTMEVTGKDGVPLPPPVINVIGVKPA